MNPPPPPPPLDPRPGARDSTSLQFRQVHFLFSQLAFRFYRSRFFSLILIDPMVHTRSATAELHRSNLKFAIAIGFRGASGVDLRRRGNQERRSTW